MPNNPIRSNGSGILVSGSKHVTSMCLTDCFIAVILVTVRDKTFIDPFTVSEVCRVAFFRS